ncbi:thiol protease SEN102-like [Helianthus annuus]|uniref:thiol protease SEN102-like n=1 Tax=Helianthus annuus TaxID=4232 RepID=UPI000B905E31|nr:thiol protease SEN102-like [Helianthus annuus]
MAKNEPIPWKDNRTEQQKYEYRKMVAEAKIIRLSGVYQEAKLANRWDPDRECYLDEYGGCWAFSTVVSIEGINAIKTGELVSLSEQQLIDCADGINQGCRGGIMEPTFISSNYMEIRHPLITIDGFEDVSECNEEALIKAVANQPISAAVETNDHDFQFYNKDNE